MKEEIVVNFKFPEGCRETYSSATFPALPRVGDYVQKDSPQSGRYRIKSIAFEIPEDTALRAAILAELEPTDRLST
jgi:hypothetical protein